MSESLITWLLIAAIASSLWVAMVGLRSLRKPGVDRPKVRKSVVGAAITIAIAIFVWLIR